MATREEELLAMQLLLKILEGEKEIEISKKTLASNAFFEPYDLFRVLDRERKNYITVEDLHAFMKKYYQGIKPASIDYVFSILSKNSNQINFDAFAPEICPKEYAKQFKTIYFMNAQNMDFTPDLSDHVALDFCNLVKCVHDQSLSMDKCCAQLQDMGVGATQFYQLLAVDEKGFIDIQEIHELLDQFCHYLGKFN